LAGEHRRYGMPRLIVLLRREGIMDNHKRIERIYGEESLQVRRRRRKQTCRSQRAPLVEVPERANLVSSTRTDFPWTNSHPITGDLRASVQKLKDMTPAGVLLGSGKLATELDRLDLIDEYKLLVHPRIAGHGPTLYQGGLPGTRRLELVSSTPLRNGAVAMHYRRAPDGDSEVKTA